MSGGGSSLAPRLSLGSFAEWCRVADAIRATTRRLEKGAFLEQYLRSLDDATLPVASRFFSGIVFPRHDARTTQVGGSIIGWALRELTGIDEEALREQYVAAGDIGDTAGALLADRASTSPTVLDVAAWVEELAAVAGTTARRALVRDMLGRVDGGEARYLVKLIGGELRIGLKEAQVEEAIARAFGRPLAAVRHANLLRGDVGEVASLSRADALASATLALFHPIGFMLAQPLETAEEIVATMGMPMAVEDKYDGIRAQAHVSAGRIALFSRTLDDITAGYPDVAAALTLVGATLSDAEERPSSNGGSRSLILDGELLAVDPADPSRALPFLSLQRRLGRKSPAADMLREVPAAFVAYDLLAVDGGLVTDEAYEERRARLVALPWPGPGEPAASLGGAWAAPMRLVSTAEELEESFASARAAGNEGLVVKDVRGTYTPGRRGKAWVKLKKALATLDVVVTGVERGHGRRRGVLSDYTFAVRASADDPTLLNVGKAYSGLTDVEIAELTKRFEALTVARFGRFHQVTPEVVIEVTFDIVQRSARHKAGYALRFPRIVRVRGDKAVEEIDTLATVRRLAGDEDG